MYATSLTLLYLPDLISKTILSKMYKFWSFLYNFLQSFITSSNYFSQHFILRHSQYVFFPLTFLVSNLYKTGKTVFHILIFRFLGETWEDKTVLSNTYIVAELGLGSCPRIKWWGSTLSSLKLKKIITECCQYKMRYILWKEENNSVFLLYGFTKYRTRVQIFKLVMGEKITGLASLSNCSSNHTEKRSEQTHYSGFWE